MSDAGDLRGREARSHDRAERTHLRAVAVHERAAEFYRRLGDPERAGHEARLADIQRDGAAVERGRASSSAQ